MFVLGIQLKATIGGRQDSLATSITNIRNVEAAGEPCGGLKVAKGEPK